MGRKFVGYVLQVAEEGQVIGLDVGSLQLLRNELLLLLLFGLILEDIGSLYAPAVDLGMHSPPEYDEHKRKDLVFKEKFQR